MFTIAVCDDDMQERMQEVQIVKNIFSQKELEAGIDRTAFFRRAAPGSLRYCSA